MVTTDKDKLPGSSVVYLTDVSQVEVDDTCGMRFWLLHHEGGKGILNKEQIVSRLLDAEIHNDLRTLSTMPNINPLAIQDVIDEILSHLTLEDKQDAGKMELLYRRLGWFAAFAMYIEPTIRAEYDTLPIDPALVFDKDPLWTIAYPDRLVKDKKTGAITYWEYAPMGAGLSQERWKQSWHYNIRLHVGLAAAIANLDEGQAPSTAQVMGISRGFRSLLDNRLCHPYVWGHYNPVTQEWASTLDGRQGAWDKRPVWEFMGGVVAWVRLCGEHVAKGQFQLSPQVTLNKDILEAWCARRVHREREVSSIKATATVNTFIRAVYFPRVQHQCLPATGETCPYLTACWDKRIAAMPLKSGIYVPVDNSTMSMLQ